MPKEQYQSKKHNPSSEEAGAICSRYEQLKTVRSTRDTEWSDIVDYFMFRRRDVTGKQASTFRTEEIYDLTAYHANQKLAGGQIAYVCPKSEQWWKYEADIGSDGAIGIDDYFSKVTEITSKELHNSNFYEKIHEALLDRSAFGLMGILMEETQNGVNFQHLDIGSFVISENENGIIDTVIREFELSARNAVSKFGDKVTDKIQKASEDTPDQMFKFLHYVCPRKVYNPDSINPKDLPWKSIFVSLDEKEVIKEGGFHENPYIISRFVKIDSDPYGYGPGLAALPVIKSANIIERDLDILGEKMANPPILIPSDFEYDVDSQAGGITMFDSTSPNALPKEWQQAGRYDIGLDRLNSKRTTINDMFYVPMIEMFAALETKQPLTATEVMARQQEKIMNFSPTFSRLTSEFLDPLLTRLYGIVARQGKLPELPPVLQGADFKISYKSKIAIMLSQQGSQNFLMYWQALGSLAQVDPSVLQTINFERTSRELAQSFNVPIEYLNTELEIEQARQAQAEAAAQQQQQAMTEKAMASAPIAEALVDQMRIGQ